MGTSVYTLYWVRGFTLFFVIRDYYFFEKNVITTKLFCKKWNTDLSGSLEHVT